MNKKILSFIVGCSLVVVACGLMNRERSGEQPEQERIKHRTAPLPDNPDRPVTDSKAADDQPQKDALKDEPTVPDNHPDKEKPKPITQYDTKALDDKVIEQAKLMKEDPKFYRMHVRTEADGTKIYRMLGMHVIVNPNGEEVFLPDEI